MSLNDVTRSSELTAASTVGVHFNEAEMVDATYYETSGEGDETVTKHTDTESTRHSSIPIYYFVRFIFGA